ncbi:amino acid permease [Phyllobacterium myrsinacearum]|uniref:Proline-specific permease ProY n=1 Tax=Phyllobacterium myrsinacearum TaxID=28101 RepID=A0A2S9JPU7_9HYPH|nr:amino acid permease [Phyllobacterium myrsinacearum]PRD55102.1 proline-specific permease ProY [Phyllobacterium myrsinacearum]PWV90333.1 D-serine/D-alanine/glycine:proton symporter (AAT family) [Phyllobacterium myrsinacearum]RZV05472.1 D-serine/D-alanine/glycine:proton symporter (AAT family) [Phyllobacterium myrsinacearum]
MTMSSQSQDLPGEGDLARKLKSRHIHMIAIGGAVGVGLFLGSGKAISMAGPGLLLSYAAGGIAVFFIMRALGELLLHKPVAGSFATYAEEYVGPFAGFATGWSYWFMWVVIGMAEITAVGVYIHYWLPNVPQWIPAMITLAALYIVNVVAVRLFGELEFWFALVKVITIVALILGGLAVIVFGIGELGQKASFSNLWTHGGFLPFGVLGAVLALQMVMFAYQGVELIGVTAGEAENPEQVLPRATNGIIWRILIFYLGALAVIMALLPWNQLDPNTSPFVFVFDKLGLSIAADVINFVVITAAASSCNSGIFSNGRMLFTLARAGQAPRMFGRVNRNHIPFLGITASTAVMSIGVVLNYVVPEQAFIWITSISLVGSLWTWSIIMIAHLGYRRAVARGEAKAVHFRMPGAPVANWLVVAFLVMVAVFLGFDPSTRVALYVAPIWFGLLAIAYQFTRRQRVPLLTAS